ncbi:hypothetical protein ACH5RR_039052 [Cinchona calisaya]|uniref:Uncharacterized protein n=1 Tax=Cinchona calisaya TaxID=153742 RepID=A0ABD2Y0J9_9GENT
MISHLFYFILFFSIRALLFCRANEEEASQIMKILQKYAKISGQIINTDKIISKNVKTNDITSILQRLNNMKQAKKSKYFRLPMVIGMSKKQVFAHVKDKVRSKLHG